MSETLYVRLASQANQSIAWLIWSASQQEIIASGELNHAEQLNELSEKSATRQVIAIVPSCDISFKSLKVPGKSQRAIRAAAPYMLEDELAHEVDRLFFAYDNLKLDEQGNNCFLAAVKRQQLMLWQSWLVDAGITCKVMIPDVLMLPVIDNACSAMVIDNQVLMRFGQWQSVVLDTHLWSTLASHLLVEKNVPVHHYTALPALERDDTQAINFIAEPEELPLALMALQPSPSFNLLQGEFAVKNKRSPLVKTWVWAASLLVVALTLNLAMKGVNLWQLQQQQDAIELAIVNTYKDAFPETKKVRVTTIRSLLRSKLSDIGSTADNAGFLPMLVQIRAAFFSVPTLKPESLKFDAKRQEIRLQATADDYQSFDKFKTELEKSKLVVSQGAQNSQDNKVSGSLSIRVAS